MENWYKLNNERAVDSPALLVYPDRIRHNVQLAVSMIDDISRLRPHVKTHKTKEILQIQLDCGISKFKCATIAEAEMLGACGAPDVLLAYPLVGPKITRFIELIEKFPQTNFAAVVDHPDATEALAYAAKEAGKIISVYVDLDLGMGRTGVIPGEGALTLYRLVSRLKDLNAMGFHAYDGHVREINLEKRQEICASNFAPITAMLETLQNEGVSSTVRTIIGGSPSFPVYAKYPAVECSPGTFALWDRGYGETLPEQAFLPAAVILCRVVSLPGHQRICVDLGYKAVASENPLDQRIYFLNAPEAKPVSQSEEHLVLEVPTGSNWQIGDVLYALPIHICPTVALYNVLTVVEEGRFVNQWVVSSRNRI